MKKLFYMAFLIIVSNVKGQNIIEVTISKIGIFTKYGKDSLHLLIQNSDCLHYTKTYNPINIKLVINKSQKKVYRFKDNLPLDTLPIKRIAFKDSIYTITVVEKRDENWAHFEGQMIDCYLVLDTRKNPINKKQPKFVYWWIWDIYLNDEYTDWCKGKVTDFVQIYQGDSVRKPKKDIHESSSITNIKEYKSQSSSLIKEE